MPIPQELQALIQKDQLHELTGLEIPAFLHNDHRWVLVILQWAQSAGLLPRPSLLVTFDHHTDFAKPPFIAADDEGKAFAREYNRNPSVSGAIRACIDQMNPDDGDWISAGMELGIIGDAVVFGAETGNGCDERGGLIYPDMQGGKHSFWPLPLPLAALSHQAALADHYNAPKGLWETLGWKPSSGFFQSKARLALDIDLDVFAFDTHLGPRFPWPERIFAHQFATGSLASSLRGMTGREFMTELIRQSSIITIAREPDYCGGEKDSDEIFDLVNQYIFSDMMKAQ